MVSSPDIVRARVTDGPWGPLLGALAARGFSGEVAIESEGKRYAIELRRGMVIGATSPLASDSIVRVALTGHLITSVHIATITRALAAAGTRDEVDVVAEVARLSAEQASTLRARAVTQRAARTFAVDAGDVTIRSGTPGAGRASDCAIDIAAVIFLGARLNLSEVRLGGDLRRLGARFALAAGADALLPRFGFGAEGVAVANVLRGAGTSLAELEASHREIDPRIAAATIYALLSCGAAIATEPGRATSEAPPPPVPVPVPVPVPITEPSVARAPTLPRTRSDVMPPATFRTPTRPLPPRTVTPRWTPEARAEIAAVVASRLALIDQGVDYFSVLGLALDAPVEAVTVAHATLARVLQPEALAQHGSPDLSRAGARLLEQITNAVSVLTNPARRAAYVAALSRGGDPLLRIPRTRTIEEERSPVDEALHRGLLALRADQPSRAAVELARACELEPGNVDHAVLLGWARFCAATDKASVALETRKLLLGASRQSERPQVALFYLGRVERMLGRDREALEYFRAALEHDPANLEASAEVRVLEARLSTGGSRSRR